MPPKRQAAVGFIFITLFLDVMGWGLIIPVLPTLVSSLKGVPINQASSYGAILLFGYAFSQFLFAPVLGNLSDQFGRRPILLLSLFGFSVNYLLLAWAPSFFWLIIGRIVAGVAGSSVSTAGAYIADVSTESTRAKNYGMVGAAFGLGFIIGPAVGGLVASLGVRAPFYAAAVLCLLNGLYGYFILPESLSIENRRKFSWKRANPFGALKIFLSHPTVARLAIVYFLIYLGAQAVQSTWSYFTMYRFGWNEKIVGISLAVVGLLVAVVQSVLVRIVNPRIGNEKSIYVGLAFYTIGLFSFAFASMGWMMFVFLIPYCLGGLAGPSLQSTLASLLPPNVQGELQGALTSLMSLTAIIGPLIMNNLFAYFTRPDSTIHFPGIAFFLGSLAMLSSLIISKLTFNRANAR
ncbi:MAG TPA: tetracycline resistance MFS efflux pump [Chitinophagaceae bacterium]|nr:MFS transporter [Chitinophagaceae bacterium]NBY25206.1 MFS transporter [Chitinophagaceae bacterium]HAL95932.1 tetracycline resistance MFS efflux pump [Chitinophagaceae bacterium]